MSTTDRAGGAGFFERQMATYATYHTNARNRLTHFIGIPAIVFSIMLVLAPARIELAGLALSWGILVTAAAFVLWVALDRAIGLAMALFLVPALVVAEAWIGARPGDAWIAFAVFFVGGWVFQFSGHAIEGRRPALVDNLFQALIGPMFIAAELLFAAGLKRDLKDRVAALAAAAGPAR
jgi:uncharacterized membrane protein YGL010W